MVSRRLLLSATIVCLLVGALGAFLYGQQRAARCLAVPVFADGLLPNADLASPGAVDGLPAGWGRAAGGVQLRRPSDPDGGFDLDGDGRALQLLGIANYAQTPSIPVAPGERYCFSGYALSDSPLRSPTRARLRFQWRDSAGAAVSEDTTLWQGVTLWTPEAPPRDWSPLQGSFVAPPEVVELAVRIEPASDDRIYLDVMQLRRGGDGLADLAAPLLLPPAEELPTIASWPQGRRAAVAFSFDWETAMGGLIHSRSVDDPRASQDYLLRGLRMREGITTTLKLFEPYGVRATYFATGYNFLRGNPERRRFMGDPTFGWATSDNGWTSDRWAGTPWFGDDPYGTVASAPEWYFGDLIAPLQQAGQEIQSHTFAHLYGGYADPSSWRADLDAWNALAAEAGVPAASALAFPWSGSDGMSDANWDELERAGIVALTRTSDHGPHNLFPVDEQGLVAAPRCRWLPGREERMLTCPDFYLTEGSAILALAQIDRALAAGGMIDLWAHTEEVTTPAQIAAWEQVVARVAQDPQLWVAPFGEIAAWQLGAAQVRVELLPATGDGGTRWAVTNESGQALVGLGLRMPANTGRVALGGDLLAVGVGQPEQPGWWPDASLATFDLAAGQRVEVTAWPAE